MVQFGGFGIQIVLVFGVAADVQRQAFGDADAALAQGFQFFGVVGQQADAADVEIVVDVFGDGEIARIHGQVEGEIGFYGIHALVLQGVGADFVDEPDAAPFLAQIDENAAPFLADGVQGCFKLGAAVAFLREECVSGKAFGVDAGENGRAVCNIAHNKGDVFLPAAAVFKTVHLEYAVCGGQAAGGDVADGGGCVVCGGHCCCAAAFQAA